jgi:hypothetical protein
LSPGGNKHWFDWFLFWKKRHGLIIIIGVSTMCLEKPKLNGSLIKIWKTNI